MAVRLAFFVSSFVAAVSVSSAATIYQDTFTRGTVGSPLALNGSTPDIAPAGEVWAANANFTTDGTAANDPFSGSQFNHAHVHFTITPGTTYTLSVYVDPADTTTGSWASIGFQSTAVSLNANQGADSNTSAWMLLRDNGGTQTFVFGGSGENGPSFATGSAHTLTAILAVAADGTGKASFAIDGNAITRASNPTLSAAQVNNINAVGMGRFSSLGVTFGSFTLDAVPEPAALAILGLTGLLLPRRHGGRAAR